jgi:DNA-binding winged helix-turn-helix (wHTH) protein
MHGRFFVGKGEVKPLSTEQEELRTFPRRAILEFAAGREYTSASQLAAMPDATPSQGRMRFDAYDADLRTGELRKHGRKIRLAGRPFQVLAMLLERPGELLTRKELQESLWTADTFVDFEHGVNAAIQTLRRALSDSHKKPRFIETLPRRGYRFIAAVEKMERLPLAPQVESSAVSATSAPASEWVGKVARICDVEGRECVLIPISEEILEEVRGCDTANDDLGRALLIAAKKLLLVPCGTEVKVLEARNPARGCTARIMDGEFFGDKVFVPLLNLQGLP